MRTSKNERKLAEEYVMKRKEYYSGVPQREIQQAIGKVAKALSDIAAKEPRKSRAKVKSET